MFERFTDKGRKIIVLAREEAERHQNDYLGTEHLVLAILRETDGVALMILKKMGLSTEQIRLEIERNLPGGGTTMTFGEIPFSPRVKKVIEYAVEEARLLGHNHIGGEHLLLGLLREEEGIGGERSPGLPGRTPSCPPTNSPLASERAPPGCGPGN